MAIVLKKTARQEPVTEQHIAALAEMIDKVGALQEEAELIKARIKKEEAKLKPYAAAVKALQDAINNLDIDADSTFEESGAAFIVEVGTKAKSRAVKDLPLIRKMLGEATFMQLATVKMGDLDKYLTPPQLAQVLATERGSRSMKLNRKEA